MTRQKYSISGLATELQKDRRTIAKMVDEIEPCEAKGKSKKYYMSDVVQYLTVGGSGKKSIEKVRLEAEQLKTEKLRIELGLMRDEVIYVNDFADFLTPMLSNFRAKAMNLPNQIAPIILSAQRVEEAEGIIRKHIYEMLKELSEYDPKKQQHRKNNR